LHIENNIDLYIVSGGSLDRYGQIPEEILGPVAASVVRGLRYLWGLKIMHRGKCWYVTPCYPRGGTGWRVRFSVDKFRI